MKTIEVKTGFGYYKDSQDRVISLAELPAGRHDLSDGLVYVEVDTKAELDAIVAYQVPPTEDEINEAKIRNRIRANAIAELKGEGQLPGDYE